MWLLPFRSKSYTVNLSDSQFESELEKLLRGRYDAGRTNNGKSTDGRIDKQNKTFSLTARSRVLRSGQRFDKARGKANPNVKGSYSPTANNTIIHLRAIPSLFEIMAAIIIAAAIPLINLVGNAELQWWIIAAIISAFYLFYLISFRFESSARFSSFEEYFKESITHYKAA